MKPTLKFSALVILFVVATILVSRPPVRGQVLQLPDVLLKSDTVEELGGILARSCKRRGLRGWTRTVKSVHSGTVGVNCGMLVRWSE